MCFHAPIGSVRTATTLRPLAAATAQLGFARVNEQGQMVAPPQTLLHVSVGRGVSQFGKLEAANG